MQPGNELVHYEDNTPPIHAQHDLHAAHLGPRWAALIGVFSIGIVYLFLPDKLIVGPRWLFLVLEVGLVAPFFVSKVTRRLLPHRVMRWLGLCLLALTTLAFAVGLFSLIATLNGAHGNELLRTAGLMWVFNLLVFSLWYFEIDGGGPLQRHLNGYKSIDFLFPQQVSSSAETKAPVWVPHFLDYFFLAFTGATALSPADTYPLTKKAKVLMMIEASFSVIIIVLLAARAVNILGS